VSGYERVIAPLESETNYVSLTGRR